MSRQQIIVLVFALAIVVFLFRGVFSSSDEKAIERTLENIHEQLEFNEPLKPLDIASRLNTLKRFIDEDVSIFVELDARQQSFDGFDRIKSGALAGSRMFRSTSINRLPTDIQVTGDTATATFHVIGSALSSGGESQRERFRVQAKMLRKSGSDWILSGISVWKGSE